MANDKKKEPELSPEEKQKKLDRDLDAGLYHGKVEEMRALLDAGADPNHSMMDYPQTKDESDEQYQRRLAKGQTAPIQIAARAGRGDLVALLLEYGADANNPKFKGSGPLHYAAASGKPEPGFVLLEHGADPNHVDEEGTTPLMDTIRSGNEKLFDVLLPLTKNLNQQENIGPWHTPEKPEFKGDTALMRAASRNWAKQVKALHEHGADLTISGRSQRNILHIAAVMKGAEILRYVLERAPELADAPDYRGGLPLHKALMMREEESIRLLLPVTTNMAAVEIAEHTKDGDKRGNTLVLAAADWTGNADWVKTLHEKGADLTVSGVASKNALHYAAKHEDPALTEYLLEHAPGLLNAQDDDGNTPLHIAIQNNNDAVVNALLEAKPDLTVKNKAGYAPFLFAAFSDNAHAINKLATLTPDINETDARGYNAVHICAERGNGHALAAYAKMGISITTPDSAGNPPLIMAAAAKKPDALYALIGLGADLTQTGANDYSAMHAAVAADREKNIALLAQHGLSMYKPLCNGKSPIDLAPEGQKRDRLNVIFNFVRSEQTKQISGKIRRKTRRRTRGGAARKKNPAP